ncbi:hypothetical protein DFJ73DRAFT_761093 [Zopfochytrium polystomum]|nr:hypothetical protein DFJ73DRAFT_761093 [Zopfochytrium polystomum]
MDQGKLSQYAASFATARFNDANLRGIFPPVLTMPEDKEAQASEELFSFPTYVWNIEATFSNGAIVCIRTGCSCVPRFVKIRWRLVNDIKHRTYLIYRQYRCSMWKKSTRAELDPEEDAKGSGYFSTIDERFFELLDDEKRGRFPYILTFKGGVSVELYERFVARCFYTAIGLKSSLKEILSIRSGRYAQLLQRFAKRSEIISAEIRPTPPTLADYLDKNKPPDRKEMSSLWLKETAKFDHLASALMNSAKVTKSVSLDGTRKFAKRLRFRKGQQSANLKECHLLLLARNEIGEIVNRQFVASENQGEITEFLKRIVQYNVEPTAKVGDTFTAMDDAASVSHTPDGSDLDDLNSGADILCWRNFDSFDEPTAASDNITQVMGDSNAMNHAPTDLNVRHLSSSGTTKQFEEPELDEDSDDGEMSLNEMEEDNCSIVGDEGGDILDEMTIEPLSNESLWSDATIEFPDIDEMQDILVVCDNPKAMRGCTLQSQWRDGGQQQQIHSSIFGVETLFLLERIISTLKLVCSEASFLPVQMSLCTINLRQAAAYERIPPYIDETNIFTWMKTALLSHSLVPSSKQISFLLNFMGTLASLPAEVPWRSFSYPESRSNRETWKSVFGIDAHVRKPMIAQIMSSPSKLCDDDIEIHFSISSNEIRLLRNILIQQRSVDAPWKESIYVTTVMFNSVVRASLESDQTLDLKPRSPSFIESAITKWSLLEVSERMHESINLFHIPFPKLGRIPADWTDDEKYLLDVFAKLVPTPREFRSLWAFAADMCQKVYQRTDTELSKKWENTRKKLRRKEAKNSQSAGVVDVCAETAIVDSGPTIAPLDGRAENAMVEGGGETARPQNPSIDPHEVETSQLQACGEMASDASLLEKPTSVEDNSLQCHSVQISDEDMNRIVAFADKHKNGQRFDWQRVRLYSLELGSIYSNLTPDALRQRVDYFRNRKKRSNTSSSTAKPYSSSAPNHSRGSVIEPPPSASVEAQSNGDTNSLGDPSAELRAPEPTVEHSATTCNMFPIHPSAPVETPFQSAKATLDSSTLKFKPQFGEKLPPATNKACDNCRKRKKGCDGTDRECAKKKARANCQTITNFFRQHK